MSQRAPPGSGRDGAAHLSFTPLRRLPRLHGHRTRLEVDPELVVPDEERTLAEGAVAPWSSHQKYFTRQLEALGKELSFDVDTPWRALPARAREAILRGKDYEVKVTYRNRWGRERIYSTGFEGVLDYVMRKHDETESDWSRERYQAYMREIPCPVCDGARLKPEVLAVRVGGLSIAQLCELPISEARDFLSDLDLTGQAAQIAGSVLTEINARLGFLVDVGLDYLSLARGAATLSGGEAQRIRLATQIGSGLVGVLYVLDEPSIGLHQRDNTRLIETLQRLRDLGNTLIVVEHDEDTIRSADWIVDIGPGAGELGGEVVYSGDVAGLAGAEGSITGDYLARRRQIEIPATRRKRDKGREVTVVGARENNLKDVTVSFPLGVLTAVTGVSGSGKSSLVNSILYQVLANRLNRARGVPGRHKTVRGVDHLDKVVHVDQSPIGRTPRSNPATYTGVWDHIRKIFAAVPESKVRGYGPGRFSFNIKGGRCESCKGDGTLKIEMNFLPDVYVPCEVCHGARYNRETLEIRYKDKTVADVLDMTIHQAADFFSASSVISRHLNTLVEVGLGYVRLGQSATTLSGGEAQRVKLATELQRRSTGRTIYVLDEPTTGLHFEDIRKLLGVLQGWWTRATPWSSSNTTLTSSPTPTGSSTWGPKAARAGEPSSSLERRRRSRPRSPPTPGSSWRRCLSRPVASSVHPGLLRRAARRQWPAVLRSSQELQCSPRRRRARDAAPGRSGCRAVRGRSRQRPQPLARRLERSSSARPCRYRRA